jgi:peptidoglycan/LPS O-acetylase OafA/YrhL
MLQWNALLIANVIAGRTPGWWLPVAPGWWLSAAAILVLALVSLATARWIEAPTRRLLRGAAIARPATVHAPPAAIEKAP